MTARWVVDEVAPNRDLNLIWRPISLLLKNGPTADSAYYAGPMLAHRVLRVMEAIRSELGDAAVFPWYWQCATRIHQDQQREFDLPAVLEHIDLDPKFAVAADDEQWDAVIRAGMDEGLALVGNDVGTPIIAAGHGTVEEAGYKGQYGNYVRIRHANGYQTAYGHMRSVATGISTGVKVRQGQVIGYLGSTGLSSGPHLHYEVLVSNRWVDPLSIQVPREKRLAGRQLAAFQRERVRIDELMRAPPVRVSNLEPRR